jgi:uncharacterized protein YydD (DUF2326 family)
MRIRLLKLHSEPEIFKPIEFNDGINLIMGEKVEENVKKGNKTNGVGKSMCSEFINFCLLKSTSSSRVMKIPLDKFPEDTQIILDLEINNKNIRIIRTKEKPNNPIITINKEEIEFSNLDDARQELKKLLFSEFSEDVNISFREFLDPFMRDENSEFKDILLIYGGSKQTKPHAFLFGLNLSLINEIQKGFKEIEKTNTHKLKLKKSLTEDGTKKISDIKTTLNALNDDLMKIDSALESFKANDAYETQQDDLAKIQVKIDELRSSQAALKYQLKKFKTFPTLEVIKKKEMEIVYNQFKNGLGDIVTKSVEEVVVFKEKIDEFQKKLFYERIDSLNDELKDITKQLQLLENNKIERLKIIDQKGVLKDMKNGYAIYHQKKDLYSNIQNKYKDYEKTEKEWKDLKLEKDKHFQSLDTLIFEAKNIIDSFNTTILNIHEYIMDSNEASFDIKTINRSKNKQILTFDMRIDDDGSHSVNRIKVFIYDLALLFNKFTSKRHPQFLIHDNILEVDGDTIEKSLKFLMQKDNNNFQYILTLNRDELKKIENSQVKQEIKSTIENSYKIANFTKKNRFLYGDKYSEI